MMSKLAKPETATVTVPPEWAPQKAMWTAWPASESEWCGNLDAPRRDVAALVRTLAQHGNHVRLLVHGGEAEQTARADLGEAAEILQVPYGDIWIRDTGPVFARDANGQVALRFKTNNWGHKYDLPDDLTVGDDIARLAGARMYRFDFVLEGGAVDHDGSGTMLATAQTLLNPNRNGWNKETAEAELARAFGTRKVIWIDEGLINDHTDGHIDNIARFVGKATVVCQSPAGEDDPNAEILNAIVRTLDGATDADGRPLKVVRIPGVGRYINAQGDIAPASYMNFVIANGVVVVPVYGTETENAALTALREAFPDRAVMGVRSIGLMGAGEAGGGSFHCITQQEPHV